MESDLDMVIMCNNIDADREMNRSARHERVAEMFRKLTLANIANPEAAARRFGNQVLWEWAEDIENFIAAKKEG